MKLILRILILVLLTILSSSQSTASTLISLKIVPKEWAEKELGMTTARNPFDTNQVRVRFEFTPTGKLAGFNYVELKVYSELYETSTARGEIGRLLTSSVLHPQLQTKEKVIVSFDIDRAYLNRTTISIVSFNDPDYHEHSNVAADGHGYVIWLWQ